MSNRTTGGAVRLPRLYHIMATVRSVEQCGTYADSPRAAWEQAYQRLEAAGVFVLGGSVIDDITQETVLVVDRRHRGSLDD